MSWISSRQRVLGNFWDSYASKTLSPNLNCPSQKPLKPSSSRCSGLRGCGIRWKTLGAKGPQTSPSYSGRPARRSPSANNSVISFG